MRAQISSDAVDKVLVALLSKLAWRKELVDLVPCSSASLPVLGMAVTLGLVGLVFLAAHLVFHNLLLGQFDSKAFHKRRTQIWRIRVRCPVAHKLNVSMSSSTASGKQCCSPHGFVRNLVGLFFADVNLYSS